jgi:excisionase family DNA binding protein
MEYGSLDATPSLIKAVSAGMPHHIAITDPTALPYLLRAEEVASLLRVTRKAVYSMVDRGEIPGVTKIGRRVRFRRDALLDWLTRQGVVLE